MLLQRHLWYLLLVAVGPNLGAGLSSQSALQRGGTRIISLVAATMLPAMVAAVAAAITVQEQQRSILLLPIAS